MLKSVFSQGKGQEVKTCATLKSMEVTLLVRVVFLICDWAKLPEMLALPAHLQACIDLVLCLCFLS